MGPADSSALGVRFKILGPVEAWRGGSALEIGPNQQRAVLALLLARAGQLVTVDDIVELVWGHRPPTSAVNLVHRYIGSLRRILEPDLPARGEGRWVKRSGGGYQFSAEQLSLDLLTFRRTVDSARCRTGESTVDAREALRVFLDALGLWRGRCADGVETEETSGGSAFAAIDHEYFTAVIDAAEIALVCGESERILPMLRRAAAREPLHEQLQAVLVRSLAATGQQAAALERYQQVHRRLADELGIDPGPELRRSQEEVLRQMVLPQARSGGATTAVTAEAVDAAPPDEPQEDYADLVPLITPAQLPSDLPTFVGRHGELADLARLLSDRTPVVAIDGMAGIGKTAFAVHWAHSVAENYPDGQLFVNLRGFDAADAATPPSETLRALLYSLGIPAHRIPGEFDLQVGMYRTILARKRVLVVLDNARDIDQVRPLIPGTPGSVAVVTSRNSLAGLVATEGACLLTLELPTVDVARETMARRLGEDRVAAEREAVDEIIDRCGRLPLGLAIVAARAVARPGFALGSIARDLRETEGSLDAFDTSGSFSVNVRTVFSWSYELLSTAAATLFRLLCLHPGPDFTVAVSASLVSVPVKQARALVAELRSAALVNEYAPGRYSLHDLVRAYATELCGATESAQELTDARGRMLEHYLYSAAAATTMANPYYTPVVSPRKRPGVLPEEPENAEAAMLWFRAEQDVLDRAVTLAADVGMETLAWRLAIEVQPRFQWLGAYHDWLRIMRVALAAAVRVEDRAGEAHVRRSLAGAYYFLGRYDESRAELERVQGMFAELGLVDEQAYVHTNLGDLMNRIGKPETALTHHRKALEIHRSAGYQLGEARALADIGLVQIHLGDYHDSIVTSRQAMAVLRELHPDLNAEGIQVLKNLGIAYARIDQFDEAVSILHDGLKLARTLGQRQLEAEALVALGDALHATGAAAAATAAWRDAQLLYLSMDVIDVPGAREVTERLTHGLRGP